MQDQDWRALKRIVESHDFEEPSGFDKSLSTLLKKALETKYKAISTTADQKRLDLPWLRDVCAELKIQAKGATRASYLKDALLKVYQTEKEAIFWEEVAKRRDEENSAQNGLKKILEEFYYDLCRSSDAKRLERLKSYFTQDDELEEKLKIFRKEFGIRAGVRKSTKLETRLKAISKELGSRKGVEGFD